MKAPQIIMIVIIAMGFTVTLAKHGQDKGKHNVWTWLLAAAIEIGILIWGGFFN